MSDNRIIAAGVGALLEGSGLPFREETTIAFSDPAGYRWDTIFLWIEGGSGQDAYGPVQALAESGGRWAQDSRIIALHARELSPLVRLRLAEAGVHAAVSLAWLAAHDGRVTELFHAGGTVGEDLLEPPVQQRAVLGLAAHGRLHPFLRAAASMSPEVWNADVPQARLPLTRGQITCLRRTALVEGGLMAPAFVRYASSVRRAPDLPLWTDVCAVVRQAWGHDR